MPEIPPPALTSETLRQMARELIGFELSEEEAESFAEPLNGLLNEIHQVRALFRKGENTEPSLGFELKEWPS